jgi:hypothetical protein
VIGLNPELLSQIFTRQGPLLQTQLLSVQRPPVAGLTMGQLCLAEIPWHAQGSACGGFCGEVCVGILLGG